MFHIREFVIAGAVILTAGIANAADVVPAAQEESMQADFSGKSGRFYASLHGGVLRAGDLTSSFELLGRRGVVGGINTADGYRIGGSVGYDLNSVLSTEAEISYGRVGIDSIDVGPPFNVTRNTVGHGKLLTLMGNVIAGKDIGRFRPYVGLGVGAGQLSLNADFASGVSDRDWAWAAQAFTGVDLMLTDRASIGTRYRYQRVGSTGFSDGNNLPVGLDSFGTHSFEAVLKVSFGD